MNFFKLYIGDYQRDTADLSLAEHGAYLLMLQHYYATERPLPVGKSLHRMLRAADKEEREAIDAVVARFWAVTDAGLVSERADAEIAKASAQAGTNRRIAMEREEARKAARQADERSTNRATNSEPIQTPDTRQPPTLRSGGEARAKRLPADWLPSEADWAKAVSALGLERAQRELEKFENHWKSKGDRRLDWDASWRNWTLKAVEYAESGRAGERLSAVERTKRDSEEWARRQGCDGVLAANGEPLRPQVDERLRVVAGRTVDISPDDVGF